jgi:hypothetical protein
MRKAKGGRDTGDWGSVIGLKWDPVGDGKSEGGKRGVRGAAK